MRALLVVLALAGGCRARSVRPQTRHRQQRRRRRRRDGGRPRRRRDPNGGACLPVGTDDSCNELDEIATAPSDPFDKQHDRPTAAPAATAAASPTRTAVRRRGVCVIAAARFVDSIQRAAASTCARCSRPAARTATASTRTATATSTRRPTCRSASHQCRPPRDAVRRHRWCADPRHRDHVLRLRRDARVRSIDPQRHPLHEQLCDGADGDCDGAPDDEFTDVDQSCDNGADGICRDLGVASATRSIRPHLLRPRRAARPARRQNRRDLQRPRRRLQRRVDDASGPARWSTRRCRSPSAPRRSTSTSTSVAPGRHRDDGRRPTAAPARTPASWPCAARPSPPRRPPAPPPASGCAPPRVAARLRGSPPVPLPYGRCSRQPLQHRVVRRRGGRRRR